MRIDKYIMKQNQQPYLYYYLNEKLIFNKKNSKQLIGKERFLQQKVAKQLYVQVWGQCLKF